ncbi:hypothetical protein [Pandoraea oxalativorans]|uniref:hypothetical protein n=1 Tax=Pandoraea oxalativorans TaxID=573737 RepID=UPI000A91C865|nr:hypothetical protein [Pandoraea oxalativorans]
MLGDYAEIGGISVDLGETRDGRDRGVADDMRNMGNTGDTGASVKASRAAVG